MNHRPTSGAFAAILLAACSSGGAVRTVATPPAPYRLNAQSEELLAEEPAVRAELAQVLEAWFGAPDAPAFRRLASWESSGFDPNESPFGGQRPGFDAGALGLGALREENQRAWSGSLAAIERGEFERIGNFRNRRQMSADWSALIERRDDLDDEEFEAAARAFFVERYPDLGEAGQTFGLYCARCHGREGGGDGPMATRLFPKPRDYRRGRFKFAAVEGGSKPRRADLLRTLLHGLPGSAMPSFGALTGAELSALIDFVQLLAIRGEVESILVSDWLVNEGEPGEGVEEVYALVWSRWLEAEEYEVHISVPEPDLDPLRLELGRAVFLDPARGNCLRCHGPDGRGDGPSAVRVEEPGREFVLLRDEWGEFILPRDLTSGVFRGGERREDVYLRVHCGIPGTPMPAIGASTGADGQPLLSEEETWALVDYVLSLSGKGPFGAGR